MTRTLLQVLVFAAIHLNGNVYCQDTVVVHADNDPLWGENVELVEELRIGMLDGPDEYIFGSIGAIAVGLDESVFVYDHHVPIIRQYNADGQHVRNVGRDGRGPGEYRVVLGMHVLSDGRLATWDPRNIRITVFDSAGAYLDGHRVPSGLYTSRTFAVDTAGFYYVKATDPSRMSAAVLLQRGQRPGIVTSRSGEIVTVLVKVSPAGEIVDSIELPLEEKGTAFVLMTSEGQRWNFPTAVRYAWSRNGYLVEGRNDQYTFNLPIPGGPVRRIVRSYEPVSLTRQERAQWEQWADLFERRGGENYNPIPDKKPAYRDLYVGEDGRIWVDVYARANKREAKPRDDGDERPPLEWRQQSCFDVFETDGTYLGRVTVPENTAIFVRGSDSVWGVNRGEFDEEYVVRFRIETSFN